MMVSLGHADYDLGSLTWEEAADRLPAADVVMLPMGSIEQHSIHLPVSTDTLRAEALTRELADAAPDHGLDLLRLPTLPYGYSEHHMNYAGTVTLQPDTYRAVLVEIGASLAAHGAQRLAFANFHGGNREPMKLAADRIQRDHGLSTYVVHWTDVARDRLEERFGEEWGHAGDHETSVIELFHPDLVRPAKKEPQRRKAEYEMRQYAYFDDITEQGGLGDPTNADPDFLEDVVEETTAALLEQLQADIEQEAANQE
jgi:creatinine amidohydrolase